MKALALMFFHSLRTILSLSGFKYLSNEVGQIGHYNRKTVIDIETGKVISNDRVPYDGPFAQAMPNQRPKAMKNWDQLKQSITPMIPGEGERIPWTWFHRQTYVDNTTTTLTFFNATGVPTTTNMQAAGQIPAPMYFDIYHLGIYFDLVDGAAAFTDLVNLVDGNCVLQIAQKSYWESMIWQVPAGGGVFGGVDNGTVAAALENAQNGVPDPRAKNTFWGDITIPHNQNFSVTLNWAAAVNSAANVDIIVFLEGYLYRRVL